MKEIKEGKSNSSGEGGGGIEGAGDEFWGYRRFRWEIRQRNLDTTAHISACVVISFQQCLCYVYLDF